MKHDYFSQDVLKNVTSYLLILIFFTNSEILNMHCIKIHITIKRILINRFGKPIDWKSLKLNLIIRNDNSAFRCDLICIATIKQRTKNKSLQPSYQCLGFHK